MSSLPAAEVPTLDASCLQVHQFTRKKTASLLAMLAAAALPVSVASGAMTHYVWDGNAPSASGSSRWSRTSDWATSHTAPLANYLGGLTNTDITFAGSLKTAPQMNNDYFIRTLNFASSAATFSLSSSAGKHLSICSEGIHNFSTNRQSLFSSLSVSHSQAWNAANRDLSIRGLVNLGGTNKLTVTVTFKTHV